MPVELYVLAIPFCAIPVFLVSLDYFNKSAEFERKKRNVINLDQFIQRKVDGDAVDTDIAHLLYLDKIAA